MNLHEKINIRLLQLTKRAEVSDPKILLETFVNVGMLEPMLSTVDHQVIYGRRGTGKTHALQYLSEIKKSEGDITIYIDMRKIGSSVGIYSDTSIEITERATRLLRDTLTTIHEGVHVAYFSDQNKFRNDISNELDDFISASIKTIVTGVVSNESSSSGMMKDISSKSIGINTSLVDFKLSLNANAANENSTTDNSKLHSSGVLRHHVSFGAIANLFEKINLASYGKKTWILLDEWSSVPLELQPFLADLIRRCILPVKKNVIKIAAIEQRSRFKINGENIGEYTGLEIGCDISADLNLDDFMVFEHDAKRATTFFSKLLFNQITSEGKGNLKLDLETDSSFVSNAFTQITAFEEMVRAAEGVPRDAINIASLCAQKANNSAIGIHHVRSAAKTWYLRDKESSVSTNKSALDLLHWIVNQVIAHRRARAFLVLSGERDLLIDTLFDARVIHLLKRNISSHDNPGTRYDAFKIDYGCYVDLLTTASAPQGLLPLDDDNEQFIDVPPDDYRAIRRAILDLNDFYKEQSKKSLTNLELTS
ncbi:hypothetical protein [uncultured Deefgea sp.]|uniref:ORC-CDC6 family AAA ATPase n=1 Tax=uncultured Deefgea sp. TaxID=1304914 RepID=UPI002594636D|nr:hypothetical protein [uncultured Deefgea sp.]